MDDDYDAALTVNVPPHKLEQVKGKLRHVCDRVPRYPQGKKADIDAIFGITLHYNDPEKSYLSFEESGVIWYKMSLDMFILGLADRRNPAAKEILTRANRELWFCKELCGYQEEEPEDKKGRYLLKRKNEACYRLDRATTEHPNNPEAIEKARHEAASACQRLRNFESEQFEAVARAAAAAAAALWRV